MADVNTRARVRSLLYLLVGAVVLVLLVLFTQRAADDRTPPAVNPTATPGAGEKVIPRDPIAPAQPRPQPQP